MWLGNWIFYKGVLSGQEASAKKKVYSAEETQKKIVKASSPIKAIFIKEWKLLLRTPVYALNGLAGILMGPFFAIIILFARNSGDKDMDFLQYLGQPQYSIYITLGVLAYLLFVAGMNLAAATALSREGSTFWISRLIPVTPAIQVMGKFLNGLSVSVIGILTTGIIAGFLFKLSLLQAVLVIVLGSIGSLLPVALNLIIDVYHPKLVWNNPAEAMKQNLNGLLGILVSMLSIFVYGLAVYAMMVLSLQEWQIYVVLAVFMAFAGALSLKGLMALSYWSYRKLEA
jgi:ABC-2 type transport system permease protein